MCPSLTTLISNAPNLKEWLVVDAASANNGHSGMADVAARLPMTFRRLTTEVMLAAPYPPATIAEGSKASPEINNRISTTVRKLASLSLP